MLQLKVDRTKDDGKEIWGYTLYHNGRVLKEEIRYGRVSDNDTLLQCFLGCYTWAFEKVSGYLSTGEYADEVLKVFFACRTIYTWLENGRALKSYVTEYNNMLKQFQYVEVAGVQYYNEKRNWLYKDRLTTQNITRDVYTSCISFLDEVN